MLDLAAAIYSGPCNLGPLDFKTTYLFKITLLKHFIYETEYLPLQIRDHLQYLTTLFLIYRCSYIAGTTV